MSSCATSSNSSNDNIDVPEPDNPSVEPEEPIVPDVPVDEYASYYEIFDGLYVDHKPGVYKEDFTLKFYFRDKGAKLYYSLNCSKPNRRYNDGIDIAVNEEKKLSNYLLTTSVDAILEGDTGGKCVSNMYINNIQKPSKYVLSDKQNVVTIKYVDSNSNVYNKTLTYLNTEYDIPVVSLSMSYSDWFGSKGIYNNIREEYSSRVNLEYFDNEYNEYFYINSKIKLGGNWSLGYPQRTLNLNFNKDENGEKNPKVNGHLFKERAMLGNLDKRLSNFSRFRLHNGGNCFEERTGFNDAILHNLMYGTNVSTTAYRPCIAYLNGEYWGIYSMREHYSDTYFEQNYGVDKDDVAVYELQGSIKFDDGNDTGADEFIRRINHFLKNDFSNDAIYESFIKNYIDVDSLIDVFIAQSYAGNWDFVGNNNNLKFWRTIRVDENNKYADGRLRFCLHDADFAFGDTSNYLDKNQQYSYTKFNIFRKLLENKQFKQRFIVRANELLQTNLKFENARKTIYSMADEVGKYKLTAMKRWGNTATYSDWMKEVESVIDYIEIRNKNYIQMVKVALEI